MIQFRKANDKDLDKISSVYEKIHSLQESGKIYTGWVREIYPTSATARMALERDDLFVAEYCGEIAASAVINKVQVDVYKYGKWSYKAKDEKISVLHTLAVSPEYSGKNIGKAFVEFYEKYSFDNGCTCFRMDTNEKNIKARTFYSSLGYTEAGIVPCTFNGIKGVNLVLLEKELSACSFLL